MSKEHTFPVFVHWVGGRLTRASADDAPELQVATPPVFPGGVAGVWSPEELLVAAAASCFAVTLAAVAERRALPLRALDVSGVGRVGRHDDGRTGFTGVELEASLETDAGCDEAAEQAARAAELRCLIALALDVPVHVRVQVRVAQPLAAA